MKNKYCFTVVMLTVVALCAGIFAGICRTEQSGSEKEPFLAVTSFYPVYIAAANVIGDCPGIRLENLSEPQTGCLHDFQMTPEDMKLLSSADVFLVNGGGMESFLTDTAAEYPDLAIVETAEDLVLPDGNAHAWMSVKCYRQMTAKITESLCSLFPDYEKELKRNGAEYDAKLARLEEAQQEIADAAKGKKIISFHEAYEYLAKDYGLEICYTLNLDEERQVSAGEVADVLAAVEKKQADMIFAEELYGKELSDTIKKETEIEVYYPDTLVRGEYDLDAYISRMQDNIDLLKKAFGV